MVNFIATAIFYSNKNFTMASEVKRICRDCRINVVNVCGVFELLEKYHQVSPSMFIFDCSSVKMDSGFLGKIMQSELNQENIDIFYLKDNNTTENDLGIELLDLNSFKNILQNKLDLISILSKQKFVKENKNGEFIDKASKFLMFLGFSPKHSGYSYLKEIIASLLSSGENCGSLTGDLYPSVAVKHKTCACNIERNIRNAITCAWNEYGKNAWKNYFLNLNRQNFRPSNREFILMCLDYLTTNNFDDVFQLKILNA